MTDKRANHFQIMDKNVSLGLVFGAMESAKKQFNVEDYANIRLISIIIYHWNITL
jgi:hypothetical protein